MLMAIVGVSFMGSTGIIRADKCFRLELSPAAGLEWTLALAQSSDNSLHCPTDTNCFTRKTNFIFA